MTTMSNVSLIDNFIERHIVYLDWSLFALYSLIFVFGILGNSLVIFVIISSLCLRSQTNRRLQQQQQQQQNMHEYQQQHSSKLSSGCKRSLSGMGSTIVNEDNIVNVYSRTNDNAGGHLVDANGCLCPNGPNGTTVTSMLSDNTADMLIVNATPRLSRTITQMSQSDANEFKCYNLSQLLAPCMINVVHGKLTITNFFLLNLAISDFAYLTLIPMLLSTMLYEKWIFGAFYCKIYISLAYFCQCSSIFIMLVLSVDRFISVVYPLKVATIRTDSKARIVVFFAWLISLLFIMPVTILTRLQESTCSIEWPEVWHFEHTTPTTQFINKYFSPLHAFTIYSFTINYIMPVCLIVVLYSKILRTLNQKSKRNQQLHMSKARKKSNRRISKMVFIIIVCYIVSWTPYWFTQIFFYIYQHILNKSGSLVLVVLSHFAQVVAYMSSSLNPFIYSYLSEVFRDELRLVLGYLGCPSWLLFSRQQKGANKLVNIGDQETPPGVHRKSASEESPVMTNFRTLSSPILLEVALPACSNELSQLRREKYKVRSDEIIEPDEKT